MSVKTDLGAIVGSDVDDDDMSELAAVTHEMIQTKQLLQRILLENDELYRQQREVVSPVPNWYSCCDAWYLSLF
jgi:hypothetical protein